MQLDRMALVLRPRSGWEALDLGVALYRQHAGGLYRALLPILLTVFITIHLLLFKWPGIAMLLCWWLKPAYERVILHWYSQAIFGERPTVRDLLKALPGLLTRTGLPWALTLGRFSLSRTFHLPVRELEGQTGKAYRERRNVLDRNVRSQAMWMGLVYAHFEALLSLACWALLFTMLPDTPDLPALWAQLQEPSASQIYVLIGNAFWLAAITIMEPVYVASGFMLYLNRRSELEGWDIELAFRKLTQRLTSSSSAARMLVLILAGALLLGPIPGQPTALAAPVAAQPSPAKRAIDEVMASPDFGHKETTSEWRLKPGIAKYLDQRKKDKQTEQDGWLRWSLEWIAQSMRWLVWVVGGLLIALLAVWLLRHFEWQGMRLSRRLPKAAAPAELFGLEIDPDSLPGDPAAAARERLAAGDCRGALSLLYRGCLSTLIHRHQLALSGSDTEQDCVRLTRKLLADEAHSYFRSLVAAWQQTAYGHRLPAAAAIEALCDNWPRHFRGASS